MLSETLASFTEWEGHLGVRHFFVLSGFLISRILFRCRDLIHTGSQSSLGVLQRFYVRRFLRIFPVYYATLTLTALIGLLPRRVAVFWHATYLSNVYFMRQHS
jgi:peptidoglycan/LPS O-acetylase OafA/YrhL